MRFDMQPSPSLGKIVRAVAEFYNLEPETMLSRRNFRSFVHARHMAMYLCRKLTRHSYAEIAGVFDGRDHATIINGVQRMERSVKTDSGIQAEAKYLTRTLKPLARPGFSGLLEVA